MAKRSRVSRSAFSASLNAARGYLGYNSEACAQAIGTSRRTIIRWESGKTWPAPEMIPRLLAFARSIPAPYGPAFLAALTPPADAALKLEPAFYAMADALDVGVPSLRRALDPFLAVLEANALSATAARTWLAQSEDTVRRAK